MFKKFFVSFLSFALILIPLNSYSDSSKSIVLKINSKTAYVNSIPITLDVAPTIINGRTVVPLRFVSEQFGAKKIDFNSPGREITIELDDPESLREDIKTLTAEIETLKNRIRELEKQKPPTPEIQKPSAPQNLQGIVSSEQVSLTWLASIQGTNPISGYKIYRSELEPVNFNIIGETQASSLDYTDIQAEKGKTYTYYVTAFDTSIPALESAESNRVTMSIPGKPKQPSNNPPSAPNNLQASISNNQVNLSWGSSTPGSNPIDGYKVYRAVDNSSNFVSISTLSSTSFSYCDLQVYEGKTYTYYVTAFDTSIPPIESEGSNKVDVTIKGSSNDDVTVYITDSGTKYHRDGCRYL